MLSHCQSFHPYRILPGLTSGGLNFLGSSVCPSQFLKKIFFKFRLCMEIKAFIRYVNLISQSYSNRNSKFIQILFKFNSMMSTQDQQARRMELLKQIEANVEECNKDAEDELIFFKWESSELIRMKTISRNLQSYSRNAKKTNKLPKMLLLS